MNKNFDYIIPLGENCQTAINLRSMGLRDEAFPFDWHGIRSFEIAGNGGLSKKIDLICNGFEDFFEEENYEEFFEIWQTESRLIYNKKTGLQFLQEFPKDKTIHEYFPVFVKKYQKRINRLYDVLKSNSTILFVFIEFFAHLSDNEIISAYEKISNLFTSATINFLIIRNSTELQKWQIQEKELRNGIYTFFINNSFENDSKYENGNIGNKELYRAIIYDISVYKFFNASIYNNLQKIIDYSKEKFDYLGWKINEVVPQELQKIENKIPSIITYQNNWEKDFIRRNFSDFDSKKYGNQIRTMLKNLDEISSSNVQKVLSRLQLLLKSSYANIDIFSAAEQQKIREIQKNDYNYLELQEDLFYNYGCYLPENHYEDTVFIKQLNISLLPNDIISYLKGTDFIDVGAYIGDSAFILNKFAPRKVYAFEASTQNYELMKKTLKLNNLEDVVVPLNYALGASNKDICLKEDGACSVISTQESFNKSVKMITLDSYINDHPEINVGLIKVDIEGAETDFLKGAENTIRKFRPVLLLSIYHNLSDFLNLKTEIEKLSLGYTFKVSSPTFGCIVCETNLIAFAESKLPTNQENIMVKK